MTSSLLSPSCLLLLWNLFRARAEKDKRERKGDEGVDMDIPEETFIPHFQRLSASGDDSTGVCWVEERLARRSG